MKCATMKGLNCPYKPITCSEGFCQDCRIYIDWHGHQRVLGRESVVVGRWNKDNEVCLRCGASRTSLGEMLAEGGKGNLTMVNHILENCKACKAELGSVK